MSSLKEHAYYTFPVPAKVDTEGKELEPAREYRLRRLSLREREDQFMSWFFALKTEAGAYLEEYSMFRLRILHRDLLEVVKVVAMKPPTGAVDFPAEVASWIGHEGAGPQLIALTGLILTEEGYLVTQAEVDPENALPSEAEVEEMPEPELELLGEG